MIRIPINQEQREYSKKLGEDIRQNKQSSGFRDLACADSKGASYLGFLGETVFADYFGFSRPKLIDGAVDEGFDFLFRGQKIDLKTTSRNSGVKLILFPNHLEKESEGFVLLNCLGSFMEVVGSISKDKFVMKAKEKDFGYGNRLYVTERQLEAVE